MTAPITLPRLDAATLVELRQRYEETPHVESRTRYQMILLARQEYQVPQIARIVLRSEDTVARVLNRFLDGGLDAVPRRTPPGPERRVTAAWEAELLRVIELDPHEVGQETANWTTELLAEYLGHGRRMSDVSQVRTAVARSKARGRVAIIIADNLKTHTAQWSLLVRSMLTEFPSELSLVYTPAYDPDANRIEWRCAHLTPHRHA